MDLKNNRIVHHLWLADVAANATGRPFTGGTKSDRHPRWSPDGKRILFESSRSGNNQLWTIALAGGEAQQLTHLSTGASEGTWSPDGKHVAFVSAVWPEYSTKPFAESDALNKKRQDDIDTNPVKARVFTRLFFRHWDEYVDDKRQHLFVLDLDAQGQAAGSPRDVTPGDRDAQPTSSTFSSGNDFTFSPDSSHLIFTAVPAKNEAWSTNYDVCRVGIHNTSSTWQNLTRANQAADSGPQFSRDGKMLAYRAENKPGFEADRWQIMVVEVNADGSWRGTPRSLTADWDRSPDTFAWGPRDATIYCTADEHARTPIFAVGLDSGPVRMVMDAGTLSTLSTSHDGTTLACTSAALDYPAEIRWRRGKEAARRDIQGQHGALAANRPAATGVSDGAGGRRRADANVDPQAARLRSKQKMAARLPGAWRPARGLGRRLELSLEPAALGRPGLRGRLAQSTRQHRLWPKIR